MKKKRSDEKGESMNPIDNLLERFIYSCSHELKSPIASMQGLLEIMKYHPLHSETVKCLDMMSVCTAKMNSLMHSLEEYMTNAKQEILLERVRGGTIINKVLDRFQPAFDKQHIKVKTAIHQSVPWVTDVNRVNLVLTSLISNAVAFQDPEKKEKKITIRLRVKENKSLLEVSDNGVGIPLSRQARIFDLFYRGHDHSQGPGLGLFLVKNIASKMGAKIFVKSNEKVGTSFRIASPNYWLQ
jgi:signal transduction histidine kinase